MIRALLIPALLMLIVSSCKKSGSDNPYDDWESTGKSPVIPDKALDPNSIQGLHKNIFKPTCSNSGCHDGNFEPDFRTIESSYNSLINRITTNTDPNNPQYGKRVVPGDPSRSMLLHRLSTFIPGSQGVMPLSVDPGSDWNSKKEEYIQNIKNWISDGAKNQFGENPADLDFSPQMGGLIAFADGSGTPIPRSGFNPLQVPAGTGSLKIMVAYYDDRTPVAQFGNTTVNFSLNPNLYDSTEAVMQKEPSPFNAKGVNGSNIDYWHSVTVSVAELGMPGDVIWIRTETTDNVNPPLHIPGKGTSFNYVKYFAVKLN